MHLQLLRRLFGSRSFRAAPKQRPVRPQLEPLEDRMVPVIGAFAIADKAVTGIGLDGVVSVKRTEGGNVSSGALLDSGRHVLTAAHVVDRDGDHRADCDFEVTFETWGGKFTYRITPDNIAVHEDWRGNGQGDTHGRDIALITLPEIAPLSADRYSVWYNGTDLEPAYREGVVVGYGLLGTGEDGATMNPDGRHGGFNSIDADGQDVGGPFGTLAIDFDNGEGENDALDWEYDIAGPWYGNDEAFPAKGDSGGPLLHWYADKYWVMGVCSFVRGYDNGIWPDPDTNAGANSSFGEIAYYTRASEYSGWISSKINSGPYDLVINMEKQPDGDDGFADTIDVRWAGTALQLWLNGELIHQASPSQISGIRIYGSSDWDTITIPGSLSKPVTVNTRGGRDSFTIDDSDNYVPSNVTISDSEVTLTSSRGTTSVVYVGDATEQLTVRAGSPNGDPHLLSRPGNTITVQGTNANTALAIESGRGDDRVFVQRAMGPVSVAGQAGRDTVTVGHDNTLADIQSSVGVTNATDTTTLELLGAADNANHTVEMGSAGDWGNYIRGLAPGIIFYDYTGVNVHITTGNGADTFNIPSVLAPMSIHTGGGDDTVNVTNNSDPLTLDLGTGQNFTTVGTPGYGLQVYGALDVRSTGGTTSLTLDDSGQSYAKNYTLTGSSFQAEDRQLITFANVRYLLAYGGKGNSDGIMGRVGNSFDIQDTLPPTPDGASVTVITGPGRDAAKVKATTSPLYLSFEAGGIESLTVGTPERGLEPIQGPINLTQTAGLSVTVDDSGAKTAQSFTLTEDRLQRSGAADLNFGTARDFPLYVFGGSGGNRFDIQGKRGNLTVNSGSGDDVISIGRANRTLPDLGHFVINGQGGHDTVLLRDDGAVGGKTYDVVTEQNIPVLTSQNTTVVLLDWDTMTNRTEVLALVTGSGSDTVNAQATPASLALLVNAGEGDDTVRSGAGRDLLIGGQGADLLDGGAGEDILIAGGTRYDADPAALTVIMKEWVSGGGDYGSRVANLLGGGTRLNRAAYEGDEGQNRLTGGADLDLFLASQTRDTHDAQGGETLIDADVAPPPELPPANPVAPPAAVPQPQPQPIPGRRRKGAGRSRRPRRGRIAKPRGA